MIYLILPSFLIQGILACSASYDYYGSWSPPVAKVPPTTTKGKGKHDIKNPSDYWGGWSPPPHQMKKWNRWMELYVNKSKTNEHMDQVDPEKKKELMKDRGPGSGWPDSWRDLGVGMGGVPPPPWSFVPRNTGKPARCYLPPAKGDCKKSLKRWGYNAHIDECQTFVYTGCGGNKNNFEDKLKCEELCVAADPPPDCNYDAN